MFAILETGSKQYKVEEGDVLEVELLDKDKISAANTVNFDSVLLVKDKDLRIGQPFVTDARIQAKVLEELKSPKVIVFKKKAKKQYRRTQGHRQKLLLIQIEKIELKPAKPVKDVEDVSEKPKPAAKETKKKAPAAKEKQVKTKVQEKKETPAAKEKQVKTQAQEKKQTKTKTRTPKEKLPGKEKEKE